MERHALHHIDGDPTNNTPSNLRVVTISDNMGNAAIPAKDHARLLRALLRRRIATILKQLESLK